VTKDSNKKPKRETKEIICNICGFPGKITYKEEDRDTGKVKTTTHEVKCLGHEGIHPSMWNRHPEYTKYQKYALRRKRENNANR